jgi:thiol:disulfide interchange protein DsbD
LWLTAVGLLWVLGQQVGVHAMAVTLVVFLVLTIFLKGLKTQATHSSIYWIWRALVVSIFLGSLYWAWPYWKVSANNGSNRTTDSQAITQDTWLPWSAQLQQDLLQKGQPFFIDFTAAWCITCQFNKVSALNDQAVLAAFSEKNMQLLRADWTRYDPEITLALNQMGRTGIPVYVLYTGAPESKPVLLNEVLTPAYLLPLLQSVPAIKKP